MQDSKATFCKLMLLLSIKQDKELRLIEVENIVVFSEASKWLSTSQILEESGNARDSTSMETNRACLKFCYGNSYILTIGLRRCT